MNPLTYDSWYQSKHGSWIGSVELQLILKHLDYRAQGNILDVGCGTGWFTHHIAKSRGVEIMGIDIDQESLKFAKHRDGESRYICGDALNLPYPDNSFDTVISITALCFIKNWKAALAEIVRVSRNRLLIGLLNRNSLLWVKKGRGNKKNGYQNAIWHSSREVVSVLKSYNINNLQVSTAVWVPGGSGFARSVEFCLPNQFPLGGFSLFTGNKVTQDFGV